MTYCLKRGEGQDICSLNSMEVEKSLLTIVNIMHSKAQAYPKIKHGSACLIASVLRRYRQKNQDSFAYSLAIIHWGREKYGGSATDFPSLKDDPVFLFRPVHHCLDQVSLVLTLSM